MRDFCKIKNNSVPIHISGKTHHLQTGRMSFKSSFSRCGALAHCRGFGTCGWKGAGTPKAVQYLVVAAAMPARVHAARIRDRNHLHRAKTYYACGTEELLRLTPTQKPVLKV